MKKRVPGKDLQHSAKKPGKKVPAREKKKTLHLALQHIHTSQVSLKKRRPVQIISCVTATETESDLLPAASSSHDSPEDGPNINQPDPRQYAEEVPYSFKNKWSFHQPHLSNTTLPQKKQTYYIQNIFTFTSLETKKTNKLSIKH